MGVRGYVCSAKKLKDDVKLNSPTIDCWVAYWDLPDTKNACVGTKPYLDGSHLIRINTELIINVSRIVCLYTTILLLEDKNHMLILGTEYH